MNLNIFPNMVAYAPNKLIYVCHIFVLVPFLVYSAVDAPVRLALYGECQVRKHHGYPKFLEDGVFSVVAEVCQDDYFFNKLVVIFNRLSQEIYLLEYPFIGGGVICDKRFKHTAWEVKLQDAYFFADLTRKRHLAKLNFLRHTPYRR